MSVKQNQVSQYARTVTSNTSSTAADDTIYADATSGNIIITLSTPIVGKIVKIVKIDTSINTVSVSGSTSGISTPLSAQGSSFSCIGASSFWYIERPQSPRSEVWVSQPAGYGSTDNKIPRFSTVQSNIGTAITYADSATNGGTFTINEDGVYMGSYTCQFSSTYAFGGISLNSNQLTTGIEGINNAHRLTECRADSTDTSVPMNCAFVKVLKAGDVVRAHTSGSAAGGQTEGTIFIIAKISN